MTVGVLKIVLVIPGSRSLKDKRQVVKSIKDRVRNKFNVSVAEVGGQDLWQRCELGFAAVSSDKQLIESMLQQIINLIELSGSALISDSSIEFF
ncbi:MAG: DUF503 domain-containing protein [Candidatus Schekmanbacteria bacterium]|nr:DUF503 domain-containing protein [Candidatus Schekmanbacteria bacterium]